MKKLILVRHAKSSWKTDVDDRDRPLDSRGAADAHLVAENCIEHMPAKFTVWCSDAARTSQTAASFAMHLPFSLEAVIYKKDLYTFNLSDLEHVIRSCSPVIEDLVLFGHNEAVTDFVRKFGDVSIGHIPTCGFVAMSFDEDCWDKLSKGKIDKVLFPKQLRTN